MLTLRELKLAVELPPEGAEIPTWKELREGDSPLFVEERLGDAVMKAYTNGYAAYGIGNRWTVYPINMKTSYFYSSAVEEMGCQISEKYFDDAPWYLLLMLIGEDRLQHNLKTRDSGRCFSVNDMAEQSPHSKRKSLENQESPVEKEVVRQEEVTELMDVLTEQQKIVVKQVFWDRETQSRIAVEMKLKSHSSVSNMLNRAIEKMRKCKK